MSIFDKFSINPKIIAFIYDVFLENVMHSEPCHKALCSLKANHALVNKAVDSCELSKEYNVVRFIAINYYFL